MKDPKQAWLEGLFNEHGSALMGYLCSLTGNEADAAELHQETMLLMWQVEDFEEILQPKSYMFTVARNLATKRRLEQQRFRNSVDPNDPEPDPKLVDDTDIPRKIAEEQELERVRRAFDRLPANIRAAYLLQVGHGLSYEEIAQHLGVSTHAVKKYLQQVVPRCRKELGLDEDDDKDEDGEE